MTDVMQEFMEKLGTAQPDEPTDYWDNYQTASAPNLPLDPGLYVLQVPKVGEDFKPDLTRDKKNFMFAMNPSVTYPSKVAGKKINYVNLSAKKSPYRSGSLAGDLLKAAEIPAQPKTLAEWGQVTGLVQGQEFGVEVDLRVYDSASQKTVFKNASELPKRSDGTPKTRLIYVDNVLIHNPSDPEVEKLQEQQALDKKAQGGPEAEKIKVLYAQNNILRIIPAAEVRKLRADA